MFIVNFVVLIFTLYYNSRKGLKPTNLKQQLKNNLIELFEKHFGEKAKHFEILPASGSYREYYRIKSKRYQAIGAYNNDLKENTAFIEFSKHFRAKGIHVPEVYAIGVPHSIYLIEDIGDETLFSFLKRIREEEGFSDKLTAVYKNVLQQLSAIQVKGAEGMNWSYCYPRPSFDKQSMLWDLNYFKYYFLKLAKVPFDEQALEDDFHTFIAFLLEADQGYFLYRDFQSRNIMLHNELIYFIDYQGGRRGALQYDLASLLYDAKADIPHEVRGELLEYYLGQLEKQTAVDRGNFKKYYYGYVLIRIMQAMGAFGFRGFYERKEHFLESIPYALNNLQQVLENSSLPVEIPELQKVLHTLGESESLRKIKPV